MRKNILFIFLAFILFFVPLTSSAFSGTSLERLTTDILFNNNAFSILSSLSFQKYGITKPEISVQYNGNVVRTDTNEVLNNGDAIPIGTIINFIPEPFNSTDASYRDTGLLGGLVNAQWINNADFPPNSLATKGSPYCLAEDFLHSRTQGSTITLGPFFCTLHGSTISSGCTGSLTLTRAYYVDDYPPFSINPPTVSIEHNGSAGLSCSNNDSLCEVTSSGSINSNFVFSQTFGKFYYMYKTTQYPAFPGMCSVDSVSPLASGTIGFSLFNGSPYTYTVPEINVNVNLVVTDAPQCSDGVDNDGDGDTDYPADSDCSGSGGGSEGVRESLPALTQCQDGIDNNGNGFIDYPADPACSSALDNNEESLPTSDISLSANPRLILPQSTTSLSWTALNVKENSCTISGTNNDYWNLSESSGTVTSSPIGTKTTFTLSCTDLENDVISESVSVGVVPRYQEI